MTKHLPVLYLGLSFALGVQAAPPSRESIELFLQLNQAERLHATLLQQQEAMIAAQMDRTVKAQSSGAEAQRLMDQMKGQLLTALRESLTWEAAKEIHVEVYRKNFTQEEIDGFIAFYRSPTGKALTEKMPGVMQQAAALTRERMQPVMEKLIQSFREIRTTSQDKAMTNNARMLRAASDQHFLEKGVTSVKTADIVGPGTYIKQLQVVAGETYPTEIEKGKPIIVKKADGTVITLEAKP